MSPRGEESSEEEDRSAVGQTQSWRAEDKRGGGDTVCAGGERGFGCREHIHQDLSWYQTGAISDQKVHLETVVAAVGVHWAAPTLYLSIHLSAPPSAAALVAFRTTQNASNTGLLYIQCSTEGPSGKIFTSILPTVYAHV